MTSHPSIHPQPATQKRIFGFAILCALLWFALWLTAFHPAPHPEILTPHRPGLSRGVPEAKTIRDVQNPTRFALPSSKGFSGTFLESHVNIKLSLEQPPQPTFYLPRETIARPVIDQGHLFEPAPLPTPELPFPGDRPISPIPQPGRIALFLSPELQHRATKPLQIDLSGDLPPSVRIHLRLLADGTITHLFFEPSITNSALNAAIRTLHFEPAPTHTDGWMDLRFTPKRDDS